MDDSTRAHAAIRESWSPGPSRAKLWPRTAEDGGGGTGRAVDHHPDLRSPSARSEGRAHHLDAVEDRPATVAVAGRGRSEPRRFDRAGPQTEPTELTVAR